MICPYCAADVAENRFCTSCGGMLSPSAGPACASCGHALRSGAKFCVFCGEEAKVRDAYATHAMQMIPWRNGQPRLACILSVFFPGAGQAFNGQIGKGFLFLLFSPMILPWIWSCYDAYETARVRGMRGGGVHLALHLWLVFNAFVALALILSVFGVWR
jgi:TM2 domain-containing membrane protein YozV